MSDAPAISVIVPVHDAHAFLGEALDSVTAQAEADVEIIVVDDGSNPPAGDIVRRHAPAARLFRQENKGPSAARNLGLRQARGSMAAFLDADDRWTADALATLRRAARQAPGADILQGLVRRFRTEQEDRTRERREPSFFGFNVGALLAPRELLLAVGGFDESRRRSEDVDLFMRLERRGARRLAIPREVLDYRIRAGSLTATADACEGSAAQWIRLLHARRDERNSKSSRGPLSPESPTVSVLIVVRDGMTYLPAALQSIRAQSLQPTEIVAIVGPSDDGTLAYLEAQPDVRCIAQQGTGLAAARNQAIAAAEGTLIAFHDHDDLWDSRMLEAQQRVIGMFDRPAASLCLFRTFEGGAAAPTGRDRQPPRVGWTPSALLAHRAVIAAVGGFDPDLGMGCDTDWFRRLRLSGLPCGAVPQALLRKRLHADTLSADPERNRAAMFRMLKKHRAERG